MTDNRQRMFFSTIERDALAVEICEEIVATEETIEANFDHVLDIWSPTGTHLGKVYVVTEAMLDYVHEAIECGGIGPMEGRVYSAYSQ